MSGSQAKIANFYQKHRRMPTYSELMALTGYKSKGAVSYFVDKLIENGFLSSDSGTGRLVPGRYFDETNEIKVLGLVEAGFPSPAEEQTLDTLNLEEYLIKNREDTYMLKVKGESMIDAGICDGDMVIVERTNNHKEGQIVVAEVDGEWTVKYLKKKGGKFYLQPANKKFSPIYPEQELKIVAVVKAVIRKY